MMNPILKKLENSDYEKNEIAKYNLKFFYENKEIQTTCMGMVVPLAVSDYCFGCRAKDCFGGRLSVKVGYGKHERHRSKAYNCRAEYKSI